MSGRRQPAVGTRLAMRVVVALLPCGAAAAATPVSLGDCPGGPPSIAVDVGHSRGEPGAISARGKPEFGFNLALAHAVAAALARAGAWPKLINDKGETISLAERVRLIGEAEPTLVLSVHHNSVQPQYLERWTHQGRVLDFSDRFSGFSLFVSRRNPAPAESERLARLLGEALLGHGFSPSQHHAEAIPAKTSRCSTPAPASTLTMVWRCCGAAGCRPCSSKRASSRTAPTRRRWRRRGSGSVSPKRWLRRSPGGAAVRWWPPGETLALTSGALQDAHDQQ